MKAIKDCEWEISIRKVEGHVYEWCAISCCWGESGVFRFLGMEEFGDETACRRNWRKFAKLNGIKKWRFEMKWTPSAFESDTIKLNIFDIFKLLVGMKIRDSACEISLWRFPK